MVKPEMRDAELNGKLWKSPRLLTSPVNFNIPLGKKRKCAELELATSVIMGVQEMKHRFQNICVMIVQ